jgi:uncharacterized membrane protein
MILNQFFSSNKIQKAKSRTPAVNSEKPIRSVIKTISWRIVGTLDTILISWLITGQIALALSIGSIELITKMLLYFFHERIWNKIKWGK